MDKLIKLLITTTFGLIFFIIRTLFKLIISLFRKRDYTKALLLKIKDGDTFLFDYQGKEINLRLYGIDTPEKFSSKKLERDLANNNSFFNRLFNLGVDKETMIEAGELATNYAKDLLSINEEYNIEILSQDRYGRYVGIVYLNEKETYNLEVIKSGFAVAYTQYIKDPVLKTKYTVAQQKARISNQGLWRSHNKIMANL